MGKIDHARAILVAKIKLLTMHFFDRSLVFTELLELCFLHCMLNFLGNGLMVCIYHTNNLNQTPYKTGLNMLGLIISLHIVWNGWLSKERILLLV